MTDAVNRIGWWDKSLCCLVAEFGFVSSKLALIEYGKRVTQKTLGSFVNPYPSRFHSTMSLNALNSIEMQLKVVVELVKAIHYAMSRY